MRSLVCPLLVCSVACSSGMLQIRLPQGTPPFANHDTPEAIAHDYWEILLAESPLYATQLGDRRFDAMLPDISPQVRADTLKNKRDLQARLNDINSGFLTGEALLTAHFLATTLRNDLGTEVCQRELWNVDQLSGYHLALAQLPLYQPMDSSAAATSYLTRLGHLGELLEQHTENLADGLKRRFSAPRLIVERVISQLDVMLRQPVDKSPFLDVLRRARNLTAGDLSGLHDDITQLVRTSINPALLSYRTYLQTKYLPEARVEVGVSQNPNGKDCYLTLVTDNSGGFGTPEELQQVGQMEVDRLQSAMLTIAQQEGFTRTADYVAALHGQPKQFLRTSAEVLRFNREVLDRAGKVLDQAFTKIPKAKLEVRAVEAYRERDAPAGFYEAGSGTEQPAYYYVNTYKPQTRPLFNMEALAFHEGIPGHHLQIALASELTDLPLVRRHGGPAAFVEGWALYAERLADELKLYSGPAARFGMLNYHAWRAARLVVDTGMHSMHWTREEAMHYMRENLFLTETEIANEVDRYIIWPGQALAYEAGYLTLSELRDTAQRRLGDAFSLANFHLAVLEHGALPLAIVREQLQIWIATGGR